MPTNDTNAKLIHPELSYLLTGIFFEVHNELGRYSRERQYAEALAGKLTFLNIAHTREYELEKSGNRCDFLVDNKIIVELKAKPFITRDDYYQIQRYLQSSGLRLGLLVNFRNRYLKPARIVRIDTDRRSKFV